VLRYQLLYVVAGSFAPAARLSCICKSSGPGLISRPPASNGSALCPYPRRDPHEPAL
jgi:hypothetical protein